MQQIQQWLDPVFLEGLLKQFANTVPLEVFALVGSVLEEVVAPIPSPFVMTLAGILAVARSLSWGEIAVVLLLAALGKTIGGWVFYYLAHKFEDIAVDKFGKYLGVSRSNIERLGAAFSKGWGDEVVVFAGRAIPVVPSVLVCIGAGLLHVPVRSFLLASFLGSLVRGGIFFAVGMASSGGLQQAGDLLAGLGWPVGILGGLGLAAVIWGMRRKRRRRRLGPGRGEIKFLSKFTDVEVDKVGEYIGGGLHHRVYAYGKDQVIKLPRRGFKVMYSTKLHLDEDLQILAKAAKQLVPATKLLVSRNGKYFVILQKRVFDFEYLEPKHVQTTKTEIQKLFKLDQELLEEHGRAIDYWGGAGLQASVLAMIGRGETAFMSNVVVKDGRLVLLDTELMQLRPQGWSLRELYVVTIYCLNYVLRKMLMHWYFR